MRLESLPSGWTRETLGSLANEVTSGATPQSGNPRYYTPTGGIPFAKIDDLTASPGRHLHETSLRVTPAALRETALRVYPAGTILLSMYGTVGLVRTTVLPTTANQALAALLPPFVCESSYLAHTLMWSRPRWEKYKSQTTQANINGRTVKSFDVGFPPLPEQRRIAEILDTLDEAIRKTEQVIAKLQQMKQGLLHDLLTRGIDEHGELRDPEQHPEQFKDSPLGRIPREWEVAPFERFSWPGRPFLKTGPFGSSLKGEHWVDSGMPVITIGALGEGEFMESELLFISERKAGALAAYAVEPGDIVFSRVADVGRSVVVQQSEAGWIMSSNLMWISLDPQQVVPAFVWLNLTANSAVRDQVRRSVNAGGREVANGTVLRSMRLAWSGFEEQQRIAVAANAAQTRIRAERSHLDKLRTLKHGLMDDLLTGRVRVTVPSGASAA